jgi:hypothetical protein
MPGSLPGQPQEINFSQPDNRAKVSYKRSRSTQDGTDKEAKHTKQSEHWLNQTSTSNHYTALIEEESEDQQQKAGNEHTPKLPPIYITTLQIFPTHTAHMKLKLSQTIILKLGLKQLNPTE